LLRLLNHAMYQRDLPVVYGVLWVIVPAVLVAHLAGDLLVTAAMGERKPEGRISRSWLVVGLALTLVLLIAPLFAGGDPNALNLAGRLRPPGEAGTLGTDMLGRDLLGRIGHGARVSLTIAAVSTFLATFAGGIIATVAWALGRWGMAILTPRTAVPNLFGPLLTGLVAVMIFRPSVTVLMIAFGLASIPSMIVAFRKLYRPDRTVHPASTALPAMAGVMLLTFAQILLAEIALSFLAFGVQPPSASLGNMIHETTQYIRVAPHLFWTMVPSALGLAGLFLVGHSLADSSRGEG
ncbi:MAG: ABC transporter permease, partial [Bacillota bacterium]